MKGMTGNQAGPTGHSLHLSLLALLRTPAVCIAAKSALHSASRQRRRLRSGQQPRRRRGRGIRGQAMPSESSVVSIGTAADLDLHSPTTVLVHALHFVILMAAYKGSLVGFFSFLFLFFPFYSVLFCVNSHAPHENSVGASPKPMSRGDRVPSDKGAQAPVGQPPEVCCWRHISRLWDGKGTNIKPAVGRRGVGEERDSRLLRDF